LAFAGSAFHGLGRFFEFSAVEGDREHRQSAVAPMLWTCDIVRKMILKISGGAAG